MAKISTGDLCIANGWREFFERIGWQYESCDTTTGVGRYSTGEPLISDPKKLAVKSMSSNERQAIEFTWRDRDGQPKVQPVNVAKIGGG